MSKRKLTPKQEKFCQLMSTGVNQTDAYRQAYKAENMKAATINKKSYEMTKLGHISGRIDELKAEIVKNITWSKEQSIKVLAEIAEKDTRSTPKVAAVKELNAMHGFHAPTKIAPTDPSGEFQYDPDSARTRLIELIERKRQEENK